MCQETPETPKINPEFLQVVKRGGRIEIYEMDDEGKGTPIYEGAPDLECMLDAIGIHFGFEGAEFHEVETDEIDFLDVHKKESLDNRRTKEEDPQSAEIKDDKDPEVWRPEAGDGSDDNDVIDIAVPENDHGIPDWGDDWEDDD